MVGYITKLIFKKNKKMPMIEQKHEGRLKMKFLPLLLALLALQCKKADEGGLYSIKTGDDALKVAVNYIGNDKCRDYLDDSSKAEEVIGKNNRVTRLATHMLDGKNGELISEEFKAGRINADSLQFSGDRFFVDRNQLSIEEIEANCRVLALSVDSEETPKIEFIKGGVRAGQHNIFARINLPKFGNLTCDDIEPFCTFSNIKEGKRYFVLVVPDVMDKTMKAEVSWTENGENEHEITIPHLSCSNESICPPQPAPSPSPVTEFDLPGEFTAGDTFTSKIGTRRRDVFAKLEVQAKLVPGTEREASITFKITAVRAFGGGKIRIGGLGDAISTEKSDNLSDTRSTGGRRLRIVKRPAGEYGFAGMEVGDHASITYRVELKHTPAAKPIRTREGQYSHTFSAQIDRFGLFSAPERDFQDKDGNKDIVVRLIRSGDDS